MDGFEVDDVALRACRDALRALAGVVHETGRHVEGTLDLGVYVVDRALDEVRHHWRDELAATLAGAHELEKVCSGLLAGVADVDAELRRVLRGPLT